MMHVVRETASPKTERRWPPVTKFLSDLRPSVLSLVDASAVAVGSQVCTLGQPAVEIQVRTAPVFLLHAGVSGSPKINNYNGTTSAKGEGMATSTAYQQKDSAARVRTAQVDKAKGGNARGIPPRGRPV
jgi:hypothetical protein